LSFEGRTEKAKTLIEIIQKHIWANLPYLLHVEFGYETYIPSEVRTAFRYVYNEKFRHIRYALREMVRTALIQKGMKI